VDRLDGPDEADHPEEGGCRQTKQEGGVVRPDLVAVHESHHVLLRVEDEVDKGGDGLHEDDGVIDHNDAVVSRSIDPGAHKLELPIVEPFRIRRVDP